jgi:hypothetical protein
MTDARPFGSVQYTLFVCEDSTLFDELEDSDKVKPMETSNVKTTEIIQEENFIDTGPYAQVFFPDE